MSDSLANERTLDQPSDDGQVERASAEQSQSGTDGQPSTDGQAAKERENIRKLQSTYDQKLAMQARQLQQYQQSQTYLQQQLDAMQEAAAPDDYARLELKLQRAEQKAQAYEAQLQAEYQAREAANARMNTLQRLADKYDVDVTALNKANDYDEAIELAIELRERKRQKKQDDNEDKRERNRPDVGSGRSITTSSKWEKEYETALRSKDSAAQIRLLRQREK